MGSSSVPEGQGFHGCFWNIKQIGSETTFVPTSSYMALSPGSEWKSFVGWSWSHRRHVSILSNGYLLRGCLFLHLGKKIAKARSFSSCLFFAWSASNRELGELSISVLNPSKRFPISILETPSLEVMVVLFTVSEIHLPDLEEFLEYLLQRSRISSYFSRDTSLACIKFSRSMQSSLIPRKRRIFNVSSFNPF